MHLEARDASAARPAPWMLVRGVVVGDQMDVEAVRRLAFDLLQEAQPFDMGVVGLGPRDQLAFQIVKRCEQRDRAVADVVVRPCARVFRRQRQSGLRAFERLTLALLVAAQHQRPSPAD